MDAFLQLFRWIGFGDYNTGVVVSGSVLLGFAAGVASPFMLLRRRALMADAASHAMLPGIAIAFMIMVAFGGTGKWLPGLLMGALIAGLLGILTVLAITRYSRIRQDAALATVLSVFYGVGIVLLGFIQDMPGSSAAGLKTFILGKAASMNAGDVAWIAGVAVLVLVVVYFLFKEFTALCFDEDFAATQGLPVSWLDVIMTALLVVVMVIGLRAVGLILMIALLVTPAAAARFWSTRMRPTVLISGAIGALSSLLGTLASAWLDDVPTGPAMVLVAAFCFFMSLCFGSNGGIFRKLLRRNTTNRTVERQHLLRAIYEYREQAHLAPMVADLLGERTWGRNRLRQVIERARRQQLVFLDRDGRVVLSEKGQVEAARVVRNHRLWEMYLIEHADIAASHVDRDADRIEHVLGETLVAKLEALLEQSGRDVPDSPHLVLPGDNRR